MRRIYYILKPFLPRILRIALRRKIAARKIAAHKSIWPIDHAAARPPENWKGWPNGKKFAVVLTHDVEGHSGVEKTPALARLETEHGFRSCFNFIPEGEYRVSAELRRQLTDGGFEVGIHDLHHDGKLFRSRSGFLEKAAKINRYAQAWNAVGYRSGFMLRNLEWYHDLHIEYDASTFDTDPFEPMPEGARTIFPFWIEKRPAPGSPPPAAPEGYVELPYTLPQDSAMFLILGETSPRIWIDKLHWIARHGGMVLLNLHPDYVRFAPNHGQKLLFPSSYYAEFLRTIRETYPGQYWNPLPRELAAWYKNTHVPPPSAPSAAPRPPAGSLRCKRAAVILYSTFPDDPRPRRAAEALVEQGVEVDFFCLGEKKSPPEGEMEQGIRVFRYAMKHSRDNKLVYLLKYGRFLLAALGFLIKRSFKRKYDLVHVHNMPDILVFSALPAKLRGAKIILDLHDPMPELMTTIFKVPPGHAFVRWLRFLERSSIAFADLVFTPNDAFKRLFASRSCHPDKIQIVMNTPEEQVFDPDRHPDAPHARRADGTFRVMHHGSIVHRHGIDLLVRAIAQLRPAIPGIRLDIYGSPTPFLKEVMAQAKTLGIDDIVSYHGAKTQAEIADAIRECDLGVIPNRLSCFTEINFPTRIFEYLAMRRPVLTPSTEGVRDYFTAKDLLMFEPNNLDDLAAKILWVRDHPEETRACVLAGIEVYRRHLWSQEKQHLLAQISQLVAKS